MLNKSGKNVPQWSLLVSELLTVNENPQLEATNSRMCIYLLPESTTFSLQPLTVAPWWLFFFFSDLLCRKTEFFNQGRSPKARWSQKKSPTEEKPPGAAASIQTAPPEARCLTYVNTHYVIFTVTFKLVDSWELRTLVSLDERENGCLII